MAFTEADLVRVTVRTPQRRLDVGLPARVPVAALLPVLLRHGGTDLAGLGSAHGGWALRRLDGTVITGDADVTAQGIRHGEELRLALADESWPEFDYDDVAAAIAAGATRRGRRWSHRATRISGGVAAIMLLATGLAAVVNAGPPWSAPAAIAALLTVVLLAAGVVVARAYGDAGVGTVLGALSLPYGFVAALLGAALLAPSDGALPVGPATLSLASGVLVVLAMVGAAGVGRRSFVFVAGALAGLAGIFAALVTASGLVRGGVAPAGAAAATLGALVLLFGLVPPTAIRFGGLPRPLPPPGASVPGPGGSAAVDLDPLLASVARTDEVMTGLLVGIALVAGVSGAVLVAGGGVAGWWLTVAAATSFALRSRAFPAVRHRAATLAAAGVTAIAALVPVASSGLAAAGTVAVAALVALGMSARPAERRSPYLGRLADVAEVGSIAATVPLVCLVLGLYARVRNMHL